MSTRDALRLFCALSILVWSIVTLCYYSEGGAFDKESHTCGGYFLFRKYTPQFWQRLTCLMLPVWVCVYVTSFFV